MPDTYKVLTMFVASPSDVKLERKLLEDAVQRVNKKTRDGLGALINVRKWEDLAPLPPDAPEETMQDRIMAEVKRSELFVVILYQRYGTKEAGHAKSNTEREIDAILERWRMEPRLKLLFYFRELFPNPDQGPQEQQVRDLRARLDQLQIQHSTYKDPEDFKELLTHDAYDILMRIQASTYKRSLLRNFWRFGGDDSRPHDVKLAIVYPPAERDWFADGSDPKYWARRLTTQIAFEDHKAIQKIEKTLRLVGFNAYKVYPSTSAPDLSRMNRVWLCMSRNRQGLQHLQKHTERRSSFTTGSRPLRKRPHLIEWRADSGETVRIASPMSQYLEMQRKRMDLGGEWRGEFARVVAKDYAILARLTTAPRGFRGEDEPLREYFVGGIRGLGTWGAAWFLDRNYSYFRDIDPYGNVEVLLEVTYFDGQIHSVEDVSNRPQSYFTEQCKYSEIRASIDTFGLDSGRD